MNKPTKPNIVIPESFAENGIKTDFDNEKLTNGFDRLQPDVLAGDNLNKFIDDTYKGLNYGMAAADAINLINEGEVLTVKDGQFVSDSSGGGMPIGTIFSHTCSASFVPENSLPCDGAEYSQSQFPALWADWLVGAKLNTCTYEEYQQEITTYGKCAKFGIDTVSGKFKVPTIPDGTVIQSAMTDDKLGNSYNAGLPNITGGLGYIGGSQWKAPTPTGAFNGTRGGNMGFSNGGSGNWVDNVTFDASRSSSIYGKSNTVQPNAVTLRFFVIVATSAINQSEMNWSEWASSLDGKANVDMTNLSATGKKLITGLGMPDYTTTPLSVHDNTNFTAPYDGLLQGIVTCGQNAGGSYINFLDSNGTLIRTFAYGYSAGDVNQYAITLLVSKGITIKIKPTSSSYVWLNGRQVNGQLSFYPLKGDN